MMKANGIWSRLKMRFEFWNLGFINFGAWNLEFAILLYGKLPAVIAGGSKEFTGHMRQFRPEMVGF